MAKSVNQVILMGRLTRDPEQRTTNTGKTIVSFSIAVDRGGQDDTADFFNINAWEKLGELVMQYLSKGRRVLVQGRLRQDRWDDKETGKKQSRVEVTASPTLLSWTDQAMAPGNQTEQRQQMLTKAKRPKMS
jgi:single-strand DNA-binding protein